MIKNFVIKKLKKILPVNLQILINRLRFNLIYSNYKNLANREIFSRIYKNKLWDRNSNFKFNSGTGSHDKIIVEEYSNVINEFLSRKNLTVVDIGCGDFNIASNYYLNCKKYYGIDVVPELISHLKKTYIREGVSFLELDCCVQKIPNADCVLIKEVLQHLTNTEILNLLNNIKSFRYVIITESYPFKLKKINMDKIKGPLSRSYNFSAVEIDKEPFNFSFKKKTTLLSIKREGIGYLKTILYEN